MKITVRSAEAKDIPGIARVHYISWEETYRGLISDAFLDKRSYERSLENQKTIGPGGKLVALADDEIVGFAGLDIPSREDPSMAEIGAIYVLKKAQGLGIGRKLFEASVDAFRKAGYKKMYLWALSSNLSAAGFYLRMGMKPDGGRKIMDMGGPAELSRFSMDI